MLQLLNPIWLFGIGGILIPLIIHLWNVKTGKTLKVGSITLMGESSRQNSRSLKLMDLLLLFLRCLMIILLSVLLADPVWRSTNKKEENKAWVMVEKESFSETYSNFKNEIDSLITAGNELHLFEPGFKKAELEEMTRDTAIIDSAEKLSYWSLIRLMEQEIPQGSAAFIFTGDRLNRIKGTRPVTTSAINWKTYTPSDSTSKSIDHAYLASSGNIRAVISESNPGGTFRKVIDIDPGAVNSDIKASISNGKPQLQLNDQNIIADTSTLTIAINAEGFSNDAEYLTAAINAIQKYTSRKIKLVKPSSEQDILFWLSSKDLPSGTIKSMKPGSTIFQYAKGNPVSTNTWIEISEGQTSIQTEQITLHKRITYPEKETGFPVWEDGFGQPILKLEQQNDISLYSFYTRLDPEWTDLVWSPEFVKLLMPLLVPEVNPGKPETLDRRSISNVQLLQNSLPAVALAKEGQLIAHSSQPEAESGKLHRPPKRSEGGKTESTTGLKSYLWLLLMTVFLIERWLSFPNHTI